MKAAVLEQPGEALVISDVALLPLGAHEVRVKVGASGICHTDLSLQRGQYGDQGPTIVGHEGAGRVIKVGSDVTFVKPGDRVISIFTAVCGSCWQCVRQRSYLCERAREVMTHPAGTREGATITGMAGLGTMAEVMTVHELQLVPVETDLPDDQLALVGCGVTTGAGASLFAADVQPGTSVAVVGCGGVGMSAIQGARVAGATTIIAVDPVAEKRHMAVKFGATHGVDPMSDDAVEQVKAITGGRGVETSLEVVGRLDAMRFAYDSTCRGGTVAFVGALPSTLELNLPANDIHANAKRIIGTTYGNALLRRDIPRLVALADRGLLDLESMVSKRFGLEDVNTAFDIMESGEVIRSVLTF
jgi:S-(hydroxymethyl)glutathione dehydrogenase/alcohol dehydrogenase